MADSSLSRMAASGQKQIFSIVDDMTGDALWRGAVAMLKSHVCSRPEHTRRQI